MGSYLSEPITEKVSTDEENDKLACGASSMQGWRVSQEDAHNCILDFDGDASYFAVYDGHGGHEVALYCSQKLPEFLKGVEAYVKGDFDKALEGAFLGFDATIVERDVVAVLKELASAKEADEDSEDDEENVRNLYEEAAMPIEQVIEKYTSTALTPPALKALKDEKQPSSPYLKAKRAECSSSGDDAAVSSSSGAGSASSTSGCSSSTQPEPKEEGKVEANGAKVPEIKVDSSSGEKNDEAKEDKLQNGDVSSAAGQPEDVTSSSSPPVENGEVGKKGKGKALAKTKGVKTPNVKTRPKRTVKQMYQKLLDYGDGSDDSEDEEDKTFEGPSADSSDDDEEGLNPAIDDEEDSSDDEEDYDEEDDEADLDDEEEDDAKMDFVRNMREEPGYDSGCTAVVALYKNGRLYVANAGDSRCIVCRNGQAIEMSFDHKPEDEPEQKRVEKAGGEVTMDGRVNGGLNLSRAIGDHAYKQNKELSDREQMITALPDIRTLDINADEDEFMVLACDGIWNFMSSQEVVDFVKPGIKEGKKLSKICEEMFDHCLAPNTMGDGTGCDNMTAIIVQFKGGAGAPKKRSASPDDDSSAKRIKTDEAAPELPETSV